MKIQERYEYDPKADLLGKGGFARVFRATDTLLDRVVALKVFNTNSQHNYSVLSEIKCGMTTTVAHRQMAVPGLPGSVKLPEYFVAVLGVSSRTFCVRLVVAISPSIADTSAAMDSDWPRPFREESDMA